MKKLFFSFLITIFHFTNYAQVNNYQVFDNYRLIIGANSVRFNKNFTIAEVMYMVGFSNHSYFAKCFQVAFGKTPRQFIEQKKGI